MAGMQVGFDATFDELVDVNLRSLRRSGMWGRQRNRSMLMMGLFCALAAFAIMLVLGSTLTSSIFFGVEAGIVTAMLVPFLFRRSVEKNVREYCRKAIGATNSFRVDVEMSADGIAFSQLNGQTLYRWLNVRAVLPTAYGVDVQLSNGSVATVRARAFASPEQQKEFVALANDYLRVK